MRKLREEWVAGEWFIIQNKKVSISASRFEAWHTVDSDRDDLFRIYKKPSDTKLAIWHDWVDWANYCDCVPYIQVRGGNCSFFTIEGLMMLGGTWYYIEITHTHNYLYPIEIVEDNPV